MRNVAAENKIESMYKMEPPKPIKETSPHNFGDSDVAIYDYAPSYKLTARASLPVTVFWLHQPNLYQCKRCPCYYAGNGSLLLHRKIGQNRRLTEAIKDSETTQLRLQPFQVNNGTLLLVPAKTNARVG
eukprot:6484056-Amphidinium_carterae.3